MAAPAYDVVVVGAGPAGLQAALTLGRTHARTLVLDSGVYRNDVAPHLHNLIGHDDTSPTAFRAAGRADLARYDTVEVREVEATRITPDAGRGFAVSLADGSAVVATRVVLATGVRDTLPDKPGLADLFGSLVSHCPYCHGHEYAGTPVGLLGCGEQVVLTAAQMAPIASRRVVLLDGATMDAATAALLDRVGPEVRPEPVTGFARHAGGVRVGFASGPDEQLGGVLVSTTFAQSAPFAEQLGLALLGSGCIEVDQLGRTSVAGVYAAGDLAHRAEVPKPTASVLVAAAAGQQAAVALDRDRIIDQLDPPPAITSPPPGAATRLASGALRRAVPRLAGPRGGGRRGRAG